MVSIVINNASLEAFSKIMRQDFKTFHDLSTDKILAKINFVHCPIVCYNTCWESIYAADCNKLWIIYDRDFFFFSFLFSIKAYYRKLSTHSCSFIKIQFLRPSASYVTKEFRHFWRSIFNSMQTWFNQICIHKIPYFLVSVD